MAISPLQNALNAALNGIRSGTGAADKAAAQTVRSTIAGLAGDAGAATGGTENQASPELYSAVTGQIEARQRFSAGLTALRTADQMLQETVRLL